MLINFKLVYILYYIILLKYIITYIFILNIYILTHMIKIGFSSFDSLKMSLHCKMKAQINIWQLN
jgi:hypothetical protein